MRFRIAVWALRLGLLALILGLWAYQTRSGGVSPLLLPKIDAVGSSFWELFKSGEAWSHAAYTAREVLAAVAIAVGAGFLVAFWAARSGLRARVVEPMVVWGFMTPLVLFYPVLILWFGIGPSSKVAYAAISGFFPVAYNSLRGFVSVPTRFTRTAQAFGASRLQVDWLVKLRAARPMVTAGVRIGVAHCVIGVILGEMLSSEKGLGYGLTRSFTAFETARGYGYILFILMLVAVVQLVLALVLPVEEAARRRARRLRRLRGWNSSGTPTSSPVPTTEPSGAVPELERIGAGAVSDSMYHNERKLRG